MPLLHPPGFHLPTRIVLDTRRDALVQEFLHQLKVSFYGGHMQSTLSPAILDLRRGVGQCEWSISTGTGGGGL